jgi:inner membrane transporter RhtA
MSNPVSTLPTASARFLQWTPAWALVIIAIVSVQIGAAVAKSLFDTVGPSGVVFLRTALGAAIFFVAWRPALRGYSRRVMLYITIYGATIAFNMLLFYAAISRIPLGVTVAVAFAGPLGVAVLGSRRAVDLLWVALAGIGVLLLSPFTNETLDPIGILLAVLTAIAWAAYVILTKRVSHLLPGNSALALSMLMAALVALPFGGSGAIKVLTDPLLIITAIVVALLSSAIPFWLEFRAIRSLSPRVFGLLLALEPVVASVIGVLILSENIGLTEGLGIGLVTIAAIATTREH